MTLPHIVQVAEPAAGCSGSFCCLDGLRGALEDFYDLVLVTSFYSIFDYFLDINTVLYVAVESFLAAFCTLFKGVALGALSTSGEG